MEFSWPIFLLIMVLGVVQLAVGVVFGRVLSLPWQKAAEDDNRLDAGLLRKFANRLSGLVDSVADDVEHHHEDLERMNQELANLDNQHGTEHNASVLKNVAKIIQVNERLQAKLSDAEAKLQKQTVQIESHLAEARTDSLTGLCNRRAFDDELFRRVAEWHRKKAAFCLAMIDVDHFKQLNDQYGHPAGDQVLRSVAELLANTFREMDLVARYGGEEFSVVMPGTNVHDAKLAAERARLAVESHVFAIDEKELRLRVSLGVASALPGDDPAALVKKADEALYQAKRSGRNCSFYHDGAVCKRIPAARQLRPDEDEMQEACESLRQRMAEVADGAE